MTDPRVRKLAQVLVHYSLHLRPNDLVRIAGPALAAPLLQAAYAEALAAGAHPYVKATIQGVEELYYRGATDDQLRFLNPVDELEVDRLDAHLGVWAHWNTRNLTGIEPKRLALRREALTALQKRFLDRAARGELRWVGTQYPTNSDAQEADMSLSDYEDFVYTAGMLDREDPVAAWETVRREQDRVVAFLNTKDALELRGPDIDLRVSVRGRTWINAAGDKNFPDGEVFTGPVEDSLDGRIRFSFPAIYSGREVDGIELTFEAGRVVSAQAKKGEAFLHAMLDLDAGARSVGEFAFGTNYNIQRFTRNILFDEKIGGTLHMALGAGYPETGSKNESGLHWDMICDLRKDTEVRGDGELIYREGKFTI